MKGVMFMEIMNKIMSFLQSHAVEIILSALWVNLEYFLGRTDLVKAGSTLELVLNAGKTAVGKLLEFIKKKPAA